MTIKHFLLLILFLGSLSSANVVDAQSVTAVYGSIVSDANQAIPYATVLVNGVSSGASSATSGSFSFNTTKELPFTITISCIGYNTQEILIASPSQLTSSLKITLVPKSETIETVDVIGKGRLNESYQKIDAKDLTLMADPSGGNIESLVKTQMGVTSNNELSSQYRVRGGNYDENMIYVNDVEVYRPFLVRSGQQEGLSFVNPDLVNDIYFSAGGFDTKYNDKMSSVLDITYKKPKCFASTVSASLLGGSASLEGASKNQKLSVIAGARYKSNTILLGTLDTNGEYDPWFVDFQSYLSYNINSKWEVGFLGYLGQTNYLFYPTDRTTSFGTLSNMKQLRISFDGTEKDKFTSGLGSGSITFSPSLSNRYKLSFTSYSTVESENYDIMSQYWLQDIDPSSGQTTPESKWENGNNKDVGTSLEHARNELNGIVSSVALRGTHILEKQKVTWETRLQNESFDEQISEWNYLDSAGYSLPNNGKTVDLNFSYKANLNTSSNRVTAFLQDDYTLNTEKGKLSLSGGLRFNYWDFNNETLISPRGSISFEPEWNHHFQFRFATGVYYQSPFYKELHAPNGDVNYNIKAQKSIHYVLGSTYFFKVSNRPFKFASELYYKSLSNLIPYNVNNVRIKYLGENSADGYSAGVDFKVNGEIVEGLDTWVALSLLQTEENLTNDVGTVKNADGTTSTFSPGYIPRPTDQRFNFSLFFQDYIPKYPSVKVHLNLLYGSGLPFGPPNSDRYKATLRMPPYRRVDIGFSKEITGSRTKTNSSTRVVKNLWIGLDVFNLFDIANTISYYWVTDIRSQQYAVPNYLTTRQYNVKLVANF